MIKRLNDTALELGTLASAFLTMLFVQALAERLVLYRRTIAQQSAWLADVEAAGMDTAEDVGPIEPTPNGTDPVEDKPTTTRRTRKAAGDGAAE